MGAASRSPVCSAEPELPTALYGVVLPMAAIGYWVLQRTLIAAEGPDSALGRAIGSDLRRINGQRRGRITREALCPDLGIVASPGGFEPPYSP